MASGRVRGARLRVETRVWHGGTVVVDVLSMAERAGRAHVDVGGRGFAKRAAGLWLGLCLARRAKDAPDPESFRKAQEVPYDVGPGEAGPEV